MQKNASHEKLLRELTPEEYRQLRGDSDFMFKLYDYLWLIAPLVLIVDILLIKFFADYLYTYTNSILIVIVALGAQLYYFTQILNYNKTYLDSRSPVFKGVGKIVKMIDNRRSSVFLSVIGKKITVFSVHIEIGDKRFKVDTTDKDTVLDLGDKLEIEFSPHTLHVWKWRKVS